MTKNLNAIEKRCFTLPQFCEWSGVGRTAAFQLIRNQELEVARVNRRTLITVESAEALIERSIVRRNVK
jgi:hypothetical protein